MYDNGRHSKRLRTSADFVQAVHLTLVGDIDCGCCILFYILNRYPFHIFIFFLNENFNKMNEFFYLDESSRSLLMRRRRRRSRRTEWVNHIFQKREEHGEFHHLMDDLKSDPEKFFDYFRMSLKTFTYILESIKPVRSTVIFVLKSV